ncbi:extracellular solute-binding protein [Deinococcus aestuarii]|uniref:extracellular solute-binding protein n=1 Tax=Deinococcus aestuarii TaxID=2774531 RepID=UPI001C0D6EFA|nr:ABC transporter substrate-binding protein [Deinococcus aestuarii]
MNKTARLAPLSALLVLGAALSGAQAQGNKTIVYLTPQLEDQGYTKTLLDLSQAYSKTRPGVRVQYQNAPQTELSQKLQLLAASGNLPALFAIDQPTLLAQLQGRGQVADLEATFKRLGIYNQLNPAAVTLQKKLNGASSSRCRWR